VAEDPIFVGDDGRALIRLREKLNDPGELLDQIGVLFQAQAEKAFDDEGLPGAEKWKPRYPRSWRGINKAAAVARFARGRMPLARHYERRPVLRDTGELFRTVRRAPSEFRRKISSLELEVSSPLTGDNGERYPDIQHGGGISSRALTATVKETMARFLRSKKGKPFRPVFGPLFRKDRLDTQVTPRPWFAVTDQVKEDSVQTAKDYFADRRR